MLRGVAALLVVVHHTLEISNGSTGSFSPDWFTLSGAAGVDIFFVISGFIMVYSAFRPRRDPMRPVDFMKRRLIRIYPFYWLCLLAMMSLHLVGFMRNHPLTPGNVIHSFLLLPGEDLIIDVAWTLRYEVFFYVVFAVALLSASKLRTVLITILALAAIMLVSPLLSSGEISSFFSSPILIEFCLGAVLALVPAQMLRPWTAVFLCAGMAGILASSLMIPAASTNGLEGWARVLGWGVPAACIVASSVNWIRGSSWLGQALEHLGDASYSLYLTHVFGMIAYGFLIKATAIGDWPQVYMVPLVTLGCCAVGMVAHVVAEKPLTQFMNRRRATAPSAAVAT
ncbi:acyltransferase family protein [Aureimonas psammosilenae]|uniref:acyltransferase family protein n=1 Tax=Aureimonas psammosilenae TaxID=2495496 RepID=UPI00186A942A|nr:acyltransferase [Aureimonas psammosilenae]